MESTKTNHVQTLDSIQSIDNTITQLAAALKEKKEGDNLSIIFHNCADGLSSYVVGENALSKIGFKVEKFCLERTYSRLIGKILESTQGPVLIADLGSGIEEFLTQASSERTIAILEHHGRPRSEPTEERRNQNFYDINCTKYGISGDSLCSSSTIMYTLARMIDPDAKSYSHIPLLGPLRDKNHLSGKTSGRLDERGMDIRVFNDSINTRFMDERYEISYDGKNYVDACNLAIDATILSSVNYGCGGVEKGLELVKSGYNKDITEEIEKARKKRHEAFEKVTEHIRKNPKKIIEGENFVYFDLLCDNSNAFQGMSTKTVGDFCDELVDRAEKQPEQYKFVAPEKYIIVSQPLEPIKLLGKTFDVFEETRLFKTSIRAPTKLKQLIDKGTYTDVANLISTINPHHRDGCHLYRGATVIRETDVERFLETFQALIKNNKAPIYQLDQIK